jgi:hypothetical protein
MRKKIRGVSPDFSDWKFLGRDIEAALIKSTGPRLSSNNVCAAMTIAIEPKSLEIAMSHAKAQPLADAFAAGLVKNPDSMMKVFQITREKWCASNPSHRETIQKFIATKPFIRKENGKLAILSSEIQDGQIAQAIKLDGGPTVSIGSVKSARRGLLQPKNEILFISEQLSDAIVYLRSLGTIKH